MAINSLNKKFKFTPAVVYISSQKNTLNCKIKSIESIDKIYNIAQKTRDDVEFKRLLSYSYVMPFNLEKFGKKTIRKAMILTIWRNLPQELKKHSYDNWDFIVTNVFRKCKIQFNIDEKVYGENWLNFVVRNSIPTTNYIYMQKGNVSVVNPGDYQNNLPKVKFSYLLLNFLLDKGANPNAVNLTGQTALHNLIETRTLKIFYFINKHIIDLFLDYGFDLHKLDSQGNSILHIAAQSGDNVTCKHLIMKGAKINAQNSKNLTPLQLSVMFPKVMRTLIFYGANKYKVNDKNLNCFEIGQTKLENSYYLADLQLLSYKSLILRQPMLNGLKIYTKKVIKTLSKNIEDLEEIKKNTPKKFINKDKPNKFCDVRLKFKNNLI